MFTGEFHCGKNSPRDVSSGKQANIQGCALALVTNHGDGATLTLHFAYPASHAAVPIVDYSIIAKNHGPERASLYAVAAIDTQAFVNLSDVAGTGHHGDAALGHLPNAAAAALAAVADSVKAIQHCIFKPRGVHVSARMLGFQQAQRFIPGEATR